MISHYCSLSSETWEHNHFLQVSLLMWKFAQEVTTDPWGSKLTWGHLVRLWGTNSQMT